MTAPWLLRLSQYKAMDLAVLGTVPILYLRSDMASCSRDQLQKRWLYKLGFVNGMTRRQSIH